MPETTRLTRQLQPGFIKRANTHQLKDVFRKYASVNIDGELYMSIEDFVRKFLGLYRNDDYNERSVRLMGGIIDTSKDGLISFPEFQAFEGLLCLPDALFRIAFQLFDTGGITLKLPRDGQRVACTGQGLVTMEEFTEVIKSTTLIEKIPFDFDGNFVKMYFGREKRRVINYSEFTQFLHDFHEECAVEAFKKFDPQGTGFISAMDFYFIMTQVKPHLLTAKVTENLVAAAGGSTGGHRVSYPFFIAFNSLLNQMELVKRIYLNATQNKRDVMLTKEEFLQSAQLMSQVTPLEVDILFSLVDLLEQTSGRIEYSNLELITPELYFKQVVSKMRRAIDLKYVESPEERGMFTQVLESAYRFTLGSLAGAIGASSVYPIDLVKTRMQNQRGGTFIGELMYKSSWDCCKKVIRHEGFGGLYRGLLPQLIGVAPEKAIKLTVNDLVRDKLYDSKGRIALWGEVLAGGCAGASQVVFTNPLEIIKIRLQVAGEIASVQKISAFKIIQELGLFGLYKGAKACFLRDVPFSAIYFPAYAHVKVKFQDENGYNSPLSLLVSGAIAGIPAASLVTPADVIKTRLQVVARSGQTSYTGLWDAAKKIYAEEGGAAFWKGAGARVLRSSPQFGVTLLTYELLQRYLFIDFGGTRPSGSESIQEILPQLKTTHLPTPATTVSPVKTVSPPSGTQVVEEVLITPTISEKNLDHLGGFEVVLPILKGIESKFGITFPLVNAKKS